MGPFLEVAKKGRGLSFNSEASDSSSSRSLVRWVVGLGKRLCLGRRSRCLERRLTLGVLRSEEEL